MALAAWATALGLVAAMPSGPGPIPDTQIAEIAAAMVGRCETVLLTAETTAQGVAEHIDRAGPVRAVQLVDAVAPAVILMVRLLHPGLRIIEVVHVYGPEAVTAAKDSKADIVLLDSGRAQTGLAEPVRSVTGLSPRSVFRRRPSLFGSQVVCGP